VKNSDYRTALQANLDTMSRTMRGTIDTSASPDKKKLFTSEMGVKDVARQMGENIDRAFALIVALRDHPLATPGEVRNFIGLLWNTVNAGIVTSDASMLRCDTDSMKYPHYTLVADVPATFNQFCEEFADRLADARQDPVRLAAWVEYRVNLTDHFLSDGCNRVSIFLSAWVLMRARAGNASRPRYRDS
jgi:hypothetical protein